MGRPAATNCTRCNKDLNLDPCFTGFKRRAYCRECWNTVQREYRANNPSKTREIHLKRTYGITLEDYETLLLLQGGGCAICDTIENLGVDHSHKTNQVRGILCRNCNTFIGMIDENLEVLERAREYLLRYKDLEVEDASKK